MAEPVGHGKNTPKNKVPAKAAPAPGGKNLTKLPPPGVRGAIPGAKGAMPGIRSVIPGAKGEDLLLALDLAGVAASSGSACASGSLDPSHVLLAMGFSLDDSLSGLRLTAGWSTTEADVSRTEAILRAVLPSLVRR